MPETNDAATLGEVVGKLDSLYTMVEREYTERREGEARLRKLETKVNSLFIIGPVLLGITAIITPFIPWGK